MRSSKNLNKQRERRAESGAPAAIARARGNEFSVLEEEAAPALGGALVRLSVPDGMHIEEAVATLHERAPDLLVTPNHIYHGAQASFTQSGVSARSHAPRATGVLGMIDTGVDLSMIDAPQAVLGQHAFAGAQTVGRQHGSTVAALAIAHGMRVQVADVFANGSDGSLVASSASIAAALSWMIDNRIPVINISIEGPNNALLGELVRRAAERGHVIVAAAGNGGPLARPAFPAAFDGSIAVTAIDAAGHPYRHANRGEYIAFAAPGVDIDVTSGGHVIHVVMGRAAGRTMLRLETPTGTPATYVGCAATVN